jgi:hypothetical protein
VSRVEPPASPIAAGPPGDGPGKGAGGKPKKSKKPGRLERLTGFVNSLSGLLAAVCTVLAAIASLLGVKANDQASQITTQQVQIDTQQSHISAQSSQIAQQRGQIADLNGQLAQATSAATASPTTIATPTDTSTAPAQGGQSVYLSTISPVNLNSGYDVGPQTLSAVNYPSSIRLGCGSSEATATYPISGFRQLTMTVGIPDDAHNATGVKLVVSLTDQDGHQLSSPVTVSLDHPQKLTATVSGEVQITVHCTGQYPANQTVATYVALGNALLTQ